MTLQRYGQLWISPKIWDNLHENVTNGNEKTDFFTNANNCEQLDLVETQNNCTFADVKNSNMEEVRIYRILWKNILAAIVCLALTAFGIIEAINTNDGAGKATVGLFFGFIGLFALYQTVKVRRRPYLTITDKCLIQSRTDRSLPDYTIHFAEVDHFELTRFNILFPFERDIEVYYKKDKDRQKVFSPTFFGRIAAKLFSGADESIHVSGINMKPQELCDLLNDRVRRRTWD